jgi:nicotinamidase-related amidase
MSSTPDRTALLVIDVQQSFRQRPYWSEAEVPSFLASLQAMVDRAVETGCPVLQVFHTDEREGPQGPFSCDSPFVSTLPELRIRPDVVFFKAVHSALFARTVQGGTLEQWLLRERVERVLVTGIRTEQCCETTTRHASDLGYDVGYITDATLTFPMTSAAGRTYSAQELRDHTELVLDGRFARIVTPDAAFP